MEAGLAAVEQAAPRPLTQRLSAMSATADLRDATTPTRQIQTAGGGVEVGAHGLPGAR
jgi:hypothetical protein